MSKTSDDKLSDFVDITSAPIEIAKKYLNCFDTFETAINSYLEDPTSSPVRQPDEQYNDILINSESKTSIIKNTTVNTASFRDKIQAQENAIKVRLILKEH
jgi:hypothetical protein